MAMKHWNKIPVIVMLGIFLAGCSLGNLNSVYRSFNIHDRESIAIDAKQRVILVRHIPVPRDANGKPIYREDRYDSLLVCAEPSPDTLSVLGASVDSSVTTPQQITPKLLGALTETGSNIGLRTQTIQLLRDSMYRLCEAYLSGALSDHDYERLQRRYQDSMIGLLAIEQLTSVTTPQQVILVSSNLEKNVEGKETQSAALPGNRSHVIQKMSQPAPLSEAAVASIAQTVENIVKGITQADYTREECIRALFGTKEASPEVHAYCLDVFEAHRKQLRSEQ